MIMWCETVGPAVSVEDTLDATFLKFQAQQVNEMLDNALNHASVAIWGFFNEGPSDAIEACPAYEASSAILKARDPTRFVTWASSKGLRDKCYASATLIAINAYPDWYQTEEPKPYWDHTANSLKAGLIPDAIGKPFVISETGAGGEFQVPSGQF
jgi:beta-glucuronidase